MMLRVKLGWSLTLVFVLSGCGSGGSGGRVTGKVSVKMGASTGTGTRPTIGPGRPSNGNWALSPDKAKVTFTKISFSTGGENSTEVVLSGCTATYDRSKASGVQLLECPVSVPTGDIVNMKVYYSRTFDVLISDAANGIYTDPNAVTGFSTSVPGGGAQFASLTQTAQSGDFVADVNFPAAVTVAKGSTPTLSIITDMVHTVLVTVAGGTITFDTSLPLAPVALFGTLNSTTGKSEVYSLQSTVENVNLGSTTGGAAEIRMFYLSATEPAFVQHGFIQNCAVGNYPTQASNADPAKSVVNPTNQFRAGGYLGLDSNGKISWALPGSFTYQNYRSMITLTRVSTVGTTGEVKCAFSGTSSLTVMAPTSGSTYASGAPAFTPTQAGLMYKLIAN